MPAVSPPPLVVTNLKVANARGRNLLSVETLAVEPGTSLGIRGPSGAGKSTLLFALAGLIDNATGSVRWGENDMLSRSSAARAAFRAENIGLIFQDFLLFEELGAQANADLPALFRRKTDRAPIREQAARMLARLGISDEARSVASFSGGERQRVAVARALANAPRIVLADEPTASLDRAAADSLIDDLTAAVREASNTLIAVSHDTALLDRMDRVITVENGKLCEVTDV